MQCKASPPGSGLTLGAARLSISSVRIRVGLFLCLFVALTSASSWLVRLDLQPGRSATDVSRAGVPVLFVGSGYCLCQADNGVLQQLRQAGFGVTVLDTEPESKSYVYVMTAAGFDRKALEPFGAILTEDELGVLLRTTEDAVLGLNTLPVELCGIGMEPVVLRNDRRVPEPMPVLDSLIRELVSRVSAETSEQTLVRLRQFRTRYSTTDSCRRAIAWVRSRFADYGCDSTWLDTFRSNYAPNVIGMKLGRMNPRQLYVICGHVDCTSESPNTLAPGSDDNASGANAVLEACRVFQGIEFERTVLFIGFSGEEQGLVGSDSFVRRSRDRGDSIALAINFDMVSYGLVDSLLIVYTSMLPQTEQFAEFFVAQADTFTDLKCRKYLLNDPASDHYSFWKYGYLAIRGRYRDRTPMYHTTGDTIGPFHYVNCGTNNMPLHVELIRALVATVAKLAGAHVPVGIEEGYKPQATRYKSGPSIVRGVLRMVGGRQNTGYRAELLDIAGRKIMELRIGPNDVSGLSPGVYFVRGRQAQAVRKVVVTR